MKSILFVLALTVVVFAQSGYSDYTKHASHTQVSAGGSSSGDGGLILYLNMPAEITENASNGNKEITDQQGSLGANMNAIGSIADGNFTLDPYGKFVSLNAGQYWQVSDVNSTALVRGSEVFTVGFFVRSAGDIFPSGGTRRFVGKASDAADGPGWTIEARSTGELRLRVDNGGSQTGVDVDMGGEPASGTVWFIWARRNADDTWTIGEELTGLSTTSSVLDYDLVDDGSFQYANAAGGTSIAQYMGSCWMWNRTLTDAELTAHYNTHKATFDPTFNPSTYGSDVVWLDSEVGVTTSGSDVTLWADQSGSGNDAASGGSPPALGVTTLNTFDGIEFDGVDEFLEIADDASMSTTEGYTIFAVMKMDNSSTLQSAFRNKLLGAVASTSGFAVEVSSNTISSGSSAMANSGSSAGYSFGGGSINTSSMLLTVVLPYDRTNASIRKDGAAASTTTNNFGSPITGTTDPTKLNLGAEPTSDGRNADMHMWEFILYNDILTSDEIDAVEGYLKVKYGL